ncbi:MAG: KamA family radical SAM protein [candidate division KSB1 bacterium]|jgi:KamA family protein|nr:KamA family radical SAM protein [candidate division KSB1 bacterium]
MDKTKKVRYKIQLDDIPELSEKEKKQLREVTDKFAFRSNTYYQSLINWDDPDDPIRRLIIPNVDELNAWGRLDASEEEKYTIVPGLQHKYEFTALLLVNDVCGAYCRFCFRKRIFMDMGDEVVRDVTEGLKYIREHKEINNVLLTGGDPLVMSTNKLENIIRQLREIDHVQIIRIGTKMPAFNPYRIIDDPAFLEMLKKYSWDNKKIYIVVHFNHPTELTDAALKAVNMIQKAGGVTVNQTPLLRGINDDPKVLGSLLNELSYIGVPPYYVFQCRPTLGNKTFSVPIEEGFEIFEQARMHCSGLAKRARLVMSHSTGKIEVVGKTDDHTYFRYHRAADPQEKARFISFKSNPEAHWFDDYEEIISEYSIDNPFRCYGPE